MGHGQSPLPTGCCNVPGAHLAHKQTCFHVEDDVKEDLGELCIPVLLGQVSLLETSDLFQGPGSTVLKDV